jgi:hypothetical protein
MNLRSHRYMPSLPVSRKREIHSGAFLRMILGKPERVFPFREVRRNTAWKRASAPRSTASVCIRCRPQRQRTLSPTIPISPRFRSGLGMLTYRPIGALRDTKIRKPTQRVLTSIRQVTYLSFGKIRYNRGMRLNLFLTATAVDQEK